MKIVKYAIFLTLSICALQAGPVVMDELPSAVEQYLNLPTGLNCSQSLAEVIEQTNGKYAFKRIIRSGTYNLESDMGLCTGAVTKELTKPERVTRAWIQFDDALGFTKVSVPPSQIRTDSSGMYLLVSISESWLGEQPAGRRALLVFDSAAEGGLSEDVMGGTDITNSRMTVGHALTFTKIPPISTNVNNAGDQSIGITDLSTPLATAEAGSGCTLKHSDKFSGLAGLMFLILISFVYLTVIREQKKAVIRG